MNRAGMHTNNRHAAQQSKSLGYEPTVEKDTRHVAHLGFRSPEHKGLKRGTGGGGGSGKTGAGKTGVQQYQDGHHGTGVQLDLSVIPKRVPGAPPSDLREVIPDLHGSETQKRILHAQMRKQWADYISKHSKDNLGMPC
jgi:hypothetical protein